MRELKESAAMFFFAAFFGLIGAITAMLDIVLELDLPRAAIVILLVAIMMVMLGVMQLVYENWRDQ